MNLFEMIEQDDCVQLACLCAIVHWVGSQMAAPDAQRWAWRGAGTAYIYFCIHSFCVLKPSDSGDLLHIVFRAIFRGMACRRRRLDRNIRPAACYSRYS